MTAPRQPVREMADESQAAPMPPITNEPDAAAAGSGPLDDEVFEQAAARLRPSWELSADELAALSPQPGATSVPVSAPANDVAPRTSSFASEPQTAAASLESFGPAPRSDQPVADAPVQVGSLPVGTESATAPSTARFDAPDELPLRRPNPWVWIVAVCVVAALVFTIWLSGRHAATSESSPAAETRTPAPEAANPRAPAASSAAAPATAPTTTPSTNGTARSPSAPEATLPPTHTESHAPEQPQRRSDTASTATAKPTPERSTSSAGSRADAPTKPESAQQRVSSHAKAAAKAQLDARHREPQKPRKGTGFVSANPY